ncbi:MAG: hypothetical protein IPL35_07065 [Sphingobacteriales bacterium]|nr:hypothetical protein [Sphingobacteriales bacterium]
MAVWNGEQWEQVGSAGSSTPNTLSKLSTIKFIASSMALTQTPIMYRLNSQLNEWESREKALEI